MRALSLLLGALLLGGAARAEARATFEVMEGKGLSDDTPVQPVGGNPGRTLGAQRRMLIDRALGIWSKQLESSVPIKVLVTFTSMRCTETLATLGGARPGSFFRLPDPANPATRLAYPSALADRIAGTDLAPGEYDIYVELNDSLDRSPCRERLGGLYYGFDGRGGERTDLLGVLLHELAHGLGITSQVDVETGELARFGLDVFSAHIHDLALGRGWAELDLDERSASLTHVRQLVFDGPETRRAASRLLARGTLGLTLSPALAGFSGEVASADLPGRMTGPVRGAVLPVDAAELCGVGARSYAGAVLLLDALELTCGAWTALDRAAQRGASAVLLVLPLPGFDYPALPPPAAPRSLALPVLTLAPSDARLLSRAATGGAVEATVDIDADHAAGADSDGRPYLFAPIPVQPGSSISHFDPMVRPDLLMEPYSTDSVNHDLDLTVALMRDLGWTTACGNGRIDDGEECDAGDANADVAGSACRVGCLLPACGDGVLDRGEACDRGAANSDSEPGACRTTCVLPRCGDGVIDEGESCDGDAACSDRCALPPPTARERATQASPVAALEDDAAEGCSVGGHAKPVPWAWLLLLGVLARRRRARH